MREWSHSIDGSVIGMARKKYGEVMRFRVNASTKEWVEKLAEEWEATQSDVIRALLWMEVGIDKPEKMRQGFIDDLPHKLALKVMEYWEENEKKPMRKTG